MSHQDLRAATSGLSQATDPFPIVVHCHLRWSSGWQRPQQIHSRLAARHPILFIEEPIEGPEKTARLELSNPCPNVTVAHPHVPAGEPQAAREMRTLELLSQLADGPLGETFQGAAHWLTTPLMEPQIHFFRSPRAIVYDGAPEGLDEREETLLRHASVVFAGGDQRYLSRSRVYPNTHFLGGGVDYDHFRSASSRKVAEDLARLPRPRLGYLGTIDERLDYRLLEELARTANATIAMVGPIVNVDPGSLPKGDNIAYLGDKPYAELPSYLAGFDVCLMPFAVNEASRFLKPTETLDFLASGRPVLSTPIADVVTNFGEVVHIASRDAFATRAREILSGDRLPAGPGLEIARRSSWDAIVARMEAIVQRALASKRPSSPALMIAPPAAAEAEQAAV